MRRGSETEPKILVRSWPARSNFEHNPYQYLLAKSLSEQGATVREFRPLTALFLPADIWHWHWPEAQVSTGNRPKAYSRFVLLRLLMAIARFRRVPIVWTAHNLEGHNRSHPDLSAKFWRLFQLRIDGVQYLSASSRADAFSRFPGLRVKSSVLSQHGHYLDVARPVDSAQARAHFGLHASLFTLVFVGKVSPYKGIDILLEAFRGLEDSNVQLLIAGSPQPDHAEAVSLIGERVPNATLVLRHLTTEEISMALCAADLAVFPYQRITNSGSVLLALSLNIPVVAPAIGSVAEIAELLEGGWVRTYDGPLTSEVLSESVSNESLHPARGAIDLSAFDWEYSARELMSLYRQLLEKSRRTRLRFRQVARTSPMEH